MTKDQGLTDRLRVWLRRFFCQHDWRWEPWGAMHVNPEYVGHSGLYPPYTELRDYPYLRSRSGVCQKCGLTFLATKGVGLSLREKNRR